MELASIRQFRSGLSDYTKQGDMVLVTNYGKMVGVFLAAHRPRGDSG